MISIQATVLRVYVEMLYTQIRNKALNQYTHPFVSVDLNMMADAFKTTVAGLQKELEALIADDQIQVIDVLYPGWPNVSKDLEKKRKEKDQVVYERKKQLHKLRAKAEKAAKENLGPQLVILASVTD